MKAFVTGGTGFIGERLVKRLRDRGDDVVALVRSREKGKKLEEMGATLVEGDLSSSDAIHSAVKGCDAAFHVAAVYKVGIPEKEHEAMYDANVRGTERVLDAAFQAGVSRIVYVSTINVFGNTRGEVVDETYERPGDHSEVGNVIDQVATGKLKALPFAGLGLNLVYVDDVADGILLAYDKGTVGESYVLGGERATMRQMVDKAAGVAGRKPPKRDMPSGVIKLAAPAGPLVGKLMGFPPNFRELISASDGVTYWATDDKARRDLGYSPRDLETGLRQTLDKA
jgi:dihydroflavonol-4-reductase